MTGEPDIAGGDLTPVERCLCGRDVRIRRDLSRRPTKWVFRCLCGRYRDHTELTLVREFAKGQER